MTEAGLNRHIVNAYETERRVRRSLQETTSETINDNSGDLMETVRSLGGAAVNDMAHACTVMQGPLPYGATLVPYNIWNQFSKEGSPPSIPQSEKEVDQAIENFWSGNNYVFSATRFGEHKGIQATQETTDRQELRKILLALPTEKNDTDTWTQALKSLVGSKLTAEQWDQYTAAHNQQIEDNEVYTLDETSHTTLANFSFNVQFGLFQELTGRHQSFLFSTPTFNDSPYDIFAIRSGIRIPILPYEQVAEKLLLTASFMSHFDEQDYWLRNNAVTKENARLLAQYTTRATSYDAPLLPNSAVANVRESDEQATPSALSILASSRVPGFDAGEGDRLIRQLIIEDMPDELARYARQGLVASAALYGIYFPDPIEVKRDGHLRLSTRFIEALQNLQEISDKNGVAAIRAHQKIVKEYEAAHSAWEHSGRIGSPPKRPKPLVRTYLACPYAGVNRSGESLQPGAISQRGPAVLATYECMRPSAKDRWTRGYQRRRPDFENALYPPIKIHRWFRGIITPQSLLESY